MKMFVFGPKFLNSFFDCEKVLVTCKTALVANFRAHEKRVNGQPSVNIMRVRDADVCLF